MMLVAFLAACADVVAATPTCVPSTAADVPGIDGLALHPLLEGCGSVTDLQLPSDRELVITTKDGWLILVDLGTKTSRLVTRLAVRSNSELGLLGVAFHPQFAVNHRLVLSYNPKEGPRRSTYEVWRWDEFPLGTPVRERTLLEVAQPYDNHDGGQVQFGPDGLLYIGLGDGGSRGDPEGNGQNPKVLLGKMLRIDIDHPAPGAEYGIPADNPFAKSTEGRPEIFAWGLRNPWRFSFLPDGRLVAADVGQDSWEEIDLVPLGGNLGWNRKEGRHCYPPESRCVSKDLVEPVWEYGRDQGISVSGGYFATSPPAAAGRWLFADYGSGQMWGAAIDALGVANVKVMGKFSGGIVTFGKAPGGQIYVGNIAEGRVYTLVAR